MPNSPPLGSLPFPAYRLPVANGGRGGPCVFLSVGHWFEAEKFRAFHPELFEVLLLLPTVKEARKFARQHQAQWRGDWLAVRSRALACGLAYAWQADPDPTRWAVGSDAIAGLLHDVDLPERFLLSAAREFVRLRDAPRIAFLGAAVAPPESVGRRVNLVHKRVDQAWRLTHWQGRHTSWRVHDWAVKQFVPVRYVGGDGARLSASSLGMLTAAADHAVVFEVRKGRTMDTPLRALRSDKRIQVELDFFDPPDARLGV